jgi:chromate transporter
MIAFAYAVMDNHALNQAGWVHGLKLAATVVVAQAAWGMSKNLCPDISRKILCLICTTFLLFIPGGWVQICVLFLGGLVGGWFFRVTPSETISTSTAQENSPVAKQTRTHFAAGLALTLFFALFLLLPALAVTRNSKPLKVFDSFYRSGALVFGGGHVVLPLLHDEVVPTGWIEDDQFLAGYGAVQAMPGPLFTFSGYLGAMIFSESKHPWLGGLLCVIAIFLPAWLLIGGALPFWHYWRRKIWVQTALKGANAAVVGILLSAFFQTVLLEGIHSHWDILLAIIAFLLLEIQHVSPIIIVSGCTAICFLTTKA